MIAPTHRAQTRAHCGGKVIEPGEETFYDGCPSWIYEPLDPAARQEWLTSTANPAKAREANWVNNGRFGSPDDQFPPLNPEAS